MNVLSCSSSSSLLDLSPRPPDRARRGEPPASPTARKRSVFEFSLCLSRACLGKTIVLIYKRLKKTVFTHLREMFQRRSRTHTARSQRSRTARPRSHRPHPAHALLGGAGRRDQSQCRRRSLCRPCTCHGRTDGSPHCTTLRPPQVRVHRLPVALLAAPPRHPRQGVGAAPPPRLPHPLLLVAWRQQRGQAGRRSSAGKSPSRTDGSRTAARPGRHSHHRRHSCALRPHSLRAHGPLDSSARVGPARKRLGFG
jgi:hypothetical protein